MAKRTFAIVAVFTALLSVTLSVQAQSSFDYSEMYWTGGANNLFYTGSINGTTSNWRDADGNLCLSTYITGSGSATALYTQNCYIYDTNNKTVDMDFGDMGVASVTVGDGTGAHTATVERRPGGLTSLTVKTKLTIQTGGLFTTGSLEITNLNSSNGTVTVSGGLLKSNTSITVTNGTLNLTGGTLTSNTLTINNNGTFNYEGGTLSALSSFTNSGDFFQTGSGTSLQTSSFSMTGGTFTQSEGNISVTGTDGLTLSGGTMTATSINLNSGNGTFIQSGGTLSSYGNALNLTGSYINNSATFEYKGTLNVSNTVELNNATIDLSSFFATPGQTITLIQSEVQDGISNDSSFTITGSGWTTDIIDNRTKLIATYSGGDGKYYWSGATDNTYNTGSNWLEGSTPYAGATIGDDSFDKDCYIVSTTETVNIDRSNLGVASLTVGSGSLTETAVIKSDIPLEVKTTLTINKGGIATVNSALSITSHNSTLGTLTVNGGTVTANSTTGISGKLSVADGGSFNANGVVTVNNGGSVSVTGGEFDTTSALTVSSGGTVIVNGGTFNVQDTTNIAGSLNVQDGLYNATDAITIINGGALIVNGGTVNAHSTTDVAGTLTVTSGMYDASNAATVSGGGTLIVNGGAFNANRTTDVFGNLNISSGAFRGSEVVTVNNGGSVSVTGGTYTATNTTVNTGGTFSYKGSNYFYNTGTLLVDGGTFEFENSGSQLINKGVITIEAGNFNVKSTNSFRVGYDAIGVLNINGGSLTVGSTTTTAPTYIAVNRNATANQYNGTATFNDTFALGWGAGNGTYNLYDGTIITEKAAGLWISNDYPNTGSQFNVYGGVANFKNEGESFTIGLDGNKKNIRNVFNLYSGTVNADNIFAIKQGGELSIAKNGETGGDGVLNANSITFTASNWAAGNRTNKLNLSSGTINLGSGGITSTDEHYEINLSGGTFGTKAGAGDGWSTALNASIANNTAITFAPGEEKTITWSGNLTGDKGSLIVDGKGALTLTQQPAYKGKTTVKQGTLNLPAGGTLYNLEGGSLKSNGHTDIAAVLYASDGTTKKDLVLSNSELSKFIGSITAQTITKEGDGTLQIYGEAEGAVSVESLVISSGRVDLKGYMTGLIEVDKGATFSPGNSVGEATFGGGFILNEEGSRLLLEMDSSGIDSVTAQSFTIDNNSIIELDIDGIPFGSQYDVITATGGFSSSQDEAYWRGKFGTLPDYMTLAVVDGEHGPNSQTVRLYIDRNAVPEPSTWALLILGAAGMLYWRKRKNA